MSSGLEKNNEEFVKRFVEACGTSHPKEISELLNISYTAAVNYLQGRLPDARILLSISNQSPYSIHWILTGKGQKFVDESVKNDFVLFIESLLKIPPSDFLVEIGKLFDAYNSKNKHTPSDSPKTMTLTSDKIREEKVQEEDPAELSTNPS